LGQYRPSKMAIAADEAAMLDVSNSSKESLLPEKRRFAALCAHVGAVRDPAKYFADIHFCVATLLRYAAAR